MGLIEAGDAIRLNFQDQFTSPRNRTRVIGFDFKTKDVQALDRLQVRGKFSVSASEGRHISGITCGTKTRIPS